MAVGRTKQPGDEHHCDPHTLGADRLYQCASAQNNCMAQAALDMLACRPLNAAGYPSRRWIMIRELFIAAAVTGTAVNMAPATADPRHYDGDVPGMNYDASLGAPCDNYQRFIFGRGPGGQPRHVTSLSTSSRPRNRVTG
jgi:hypothetical protein